MAKVTFIRKHLIWLMISGVVVVRTHDGRAKEWLSAHILIYNPRQREERALGIA